MKPIKNVIWMREGGREGEKETGRKGGVVGGGDNLPLPPFLPHTLRQKQTHPLGGGGLLTQGLYNTNTHNSQ